MPDNSEKNPKDDWANLSLEEKQKLIAKVQKQLRFYQDSERRHSEIAKLHKTRIDFTRGIIYGIFYGIIGNLAVQYSLPFYEGVASARYDAIFWISTVIFYAALTTMIIATIKLMRDLGEERRIFHLASEEKTVAKWTREDIERLLNYLNESMKQTEKKEEKLI